LVGESERSESTSNGFWSTPVCGEPPPEPPKMSSEASVKSFEKV
jgi:hypothetical protein